MVRPSNATESGRAGRVPTAITMRSAVTVRTPLTPSMATCVLVDEPRLTEQQVDPVAGELAADHVDLAADHVLGACGQVADRDVRLEPVGLAVELALVQPGEVEDRLAERLGRDRPGVDADPTDHVALLDHGRTPTELGTGDGRLLPTRTGPDDEQVVVGHPLASLGDGITLRRK